jgi:hypothetical protein
MESSIAGSSRKDGNMVSLVEHADDPGQRLEVFFDYRDVCKPAEAGQSGIADPRASAMSLRNLVFTSGVLLALSAHQLSLQLPG